MSVPLDSDGFLRRECPTCEREFKWINTPKGENTAAPVADGGYFCPYCGVQSETSAWLTKAQVHLALQLVNNQIVNPMLERFGNDGAPDEFDPLTEVDDMTRVDFTCHPTEPVKVLNDWNKPVFCLICSQPNA